MNRCKRCLYPSTKPDLFIDSEGICSACRNFENRPTVDWDQRNRELEAILETGKNGSGYDCIVPSSGGKDSHYQVLTLIGMGARPLIVTATTDLLTPIGRRNIDNLARYATTIEVTPNRVVRSKLCRLGLEMVGDVSWPEHASIFSVPFRIASDFGIPLIFYGESPQREYGGPIGAEEAVTMTRRWVSEYGGLLGLRAGDFVGQEGIRAEDMADYRLPDDNAMASVSAYFLGQFIPWNSHRNGEIAADAGMVQRLPSPGSWWHFENLDNGLTGQHDHLMYRKYGYGRLSAQFSIDIRNGLRARSAGMTMARLHDGEFPRVYGEIDLEEQLDFLGMTEGQLFEALDRHTNWQLFDGVVDGRPILKEFATEMAA